MKTKALRQIRWQPLLRTYLVDYLAGGTRSLVRHDEKAVISFLVYLDMGWEVETLNETIDAEVESLPDDMRARLARVAQLIEDKGLEHVGEPHLKHIEGRLWEMRLKG